jgi:hypothetical protein
VFEPRLGGLGGMGLLLYECSKKWSHEELVCEQLLAPSAHRAGQGARIEVFDSSHFSWMFVSLIFYQFLQDGGMFCFHQTATESAPLQLSQLRILPYPHKAEMQYSLYLFSYQF